MENKTVVYKGKVYEIGKEYLFFDDYYFSDNAKLIYGRLKSICKSSIHPFVSHNGELFSNICAFSELKDHGTITPAPVELINGNVYMFKYHASRKPVFGVYSSGTGKFITTQSDHAACACTDIRKMTVEEVV
tara:strand:- start:21 stop:416 length:396 start_codon:yes stop_codon:yes gene_type:complete